MDNKRILIWSSSYAPVLGGLQRMLEQLAQEWQKQGHTVLVLTNKYPYKLKSNERVNDINVKRLIHFSDQGKGLKSFLYKCLIPFQTKSITNLIKAFNPDKVYVQFPSAQLPYLEHVYKTMPNKQWYLNFHGHDVLKYFVVDEQYSYTKLLNSAGLQRLKAFAQNQSITLTACSQWLAIRVEQVFNKKCNVVYNAVEFDFFSKKVESTIEYPYLFSYGRIEEDKGFIMLIDAYINVLSSGINLPKLLIGGDGSLMNELTTRIPVKFKQQIEFLGRLTIAEIRSYGQHADSIWIPSLRETFGLVVLESLAMNQNVYASNIGGIPEAGGPYVRFFAPSKMVVENELINGCKNEINKHQLISYNERGNFLKKFNSNIMAFQYLTA